MTVVSQSYWSELLSIDSPCYGVIIFDITNNGLTDKCVIVRTPPKKNGGGSNVGFPKGKSKNRENIFAGASRELEEETGIKFSQLQFANGIVLNELSDKGNISITYLVAKYVGDYTKHTFVYDTEELAFSGFLLLSDAIKGMWKGRQDIMSSAYDIVINPTTQFTDGVLLLDTFKNIPTVKVAKKQKQIDTKKISKFMSFVLRHGALDLGIAMDAEGRIYLSDLLSLSQMS
jgi:8-oxo-dGTP pyrophosphatase MutT (NUDIX family)